MQKCKNASLKFTKTLAKIIFFVCLIMPVSVYPDAANTTPTPKNSTNADIIPQPAEQIKTESVNTDGADDCRASSDRIVVDPHGIINTAEHCKQ